MNVLSLFDGMSCGRIALDKLGIKVNNYFAAEIDKFAIKVSKANYPEIKHIGDVTQIKGKDLPQIDLLIGGSPCQGFSFAGKQLNFDDPRSKLFFEFVRLIEECKPKYFLLENVKMKKEYQDLISQYLKVEPIEINSALVSAQNRKRLYWTNIPNISQPEDKGVILRDILEDGSPATVAKDNVVIFDKHKDGFKFSKDGLCHAGDANLKGNDSIKRVYHPYGKGPTVTTMGGGHREPKVLVIKNETIKEEETTSPNNYNGVTYRKMTPLECERLQTVPDNYTNHVSNSQRYKMLGNGWTVDVITHILKGID
tara:strand:- start:3462 stop:4394 length:933 start_codon:yes stop_codon:yes gene_type:complete